MAWLYITSDAPFFSASTSGWGSGCLKQEKKTRGEDIFAVKEKKSGFPCRDDERGPLYPLYPFLSYFPPPPGFFFHFFKHLLVDAERGERGEEKEIKRSGGVREWEYFALSRAFALSFLL